MRAPAKYALVRTTLTLLLGLVVASPVVAQNRAPNGAQGTGGSDPITAEAYISPPEALARLVTAPRESNVTFTNPSPGTRKYFLRTVSDGLPSLQLLGKRHHNLGGFQVDAAGNRQRNLTTRSAVGIEVREWETGRKIDVAIPAGARVGGATWAPDGSQIAFLALFDNATHIYLADPATGKSRQLTTRPLLATAVTNFEWAADGRSVVAILIPDGRGPEPAEPAIAPNPKVRVNERNLLKTRTYADLLETPHDKTLLEYYTTGQLAVIDTRSRAIRKIGEPGMIRSLSASPDNQYFRVTYTDKPFSYLLPVQSFGTTEVVIDGTGKVLTELSKRPLREGEDPDDPDAPRPQQRTPAQDTGKRNLAWHPFESGMLYAQLAAAPANNNTQGGRGGAPGAARPGQPDSAALARRSDRLMHWRPPFDSTSATEVYTTTNRISAVRFSENGRIMFISETGQGGTFEHAIFLDENNQKYTVVQPRRGSGAPQATGRGGGGGRFGGGGSSALATRTGSRGVPIVIVSSDGKSVFQHGSTPDSSSQERNPRVHVERIEIKTGTRTRIYESDGALFESISTPLDDDYNRILVTRESPTVVPQAFVVDVATKQSRQLTENRDLMPEITSAIRRTYTARRADGYTFRVRVTLPHDYRDGTRLPAMFWFYPREYENQEAYDRSLNQGGGGAGQRFQNAGPRSMAFLTTQGYAVVEPDAPIFASEGVLPNDNYVVDLRNNLAAVIDALDTLAIIDRHRLGIGGHSYGAFSTVNAMVHTPFFKAGIAGHGAYNRTLTPNGFQTERRDLWQGRSTYLEMSPFLYANRLTGALLMYHGTEDQNVGTAPINSERLFHALQGQGKEVSLYMYPYEDHGPLARETVLDQWARWVAWLDKYVKNARPKEETKITS